jgi:hypothetical protein
MGTLDLTDDDRREAMRLVFVGLATDQDVLELSDLVEGLHRKHDTFPGEVYLELLAEVIVDTTAAGAGPIRYEGLRERHLRQYPLRGKQNRRFQYAVLCGAALAGGLEPDLLDEVSWWGTDDFWFYALLALVAVVRASAESRELAVAVVARSLAERHGTSID